MDTKAIWKRALSCKRLGKGAAKESSTSKGRTPFLRDFDRIVFSSAFRRLQDKTQVVPLAKNDYVRTRLTHSIEASCVGRSLGQGVGMKLKNSLPDGIEASDIAQIVAAACLTHDIGNPPFGHSGEAAIQGYFLAKGSESIRELSCIQRNDFKKFEGNAQGFRVLTRLQNPSNPGLQLTCATLAAFTKYPNDSTGKEKKFGYFQSEINFFEEMAEAVGLIKKGSGRYYRHPLAFLVEAADDICFRIMDFEDAARLQLITKEEVCGHLRAIVKNGIPVRSTLSKDEQVAVLRAKAIDEIISQVTECFMENTKEILSGKFEGSLIEKISCFQELVEIKNISKERYYIAKEILEIEVPAFDVLSGLLEDFIMAVNDCWGNKHPREKSKKLLKLLPAQLVGNDGKPDRDKYQRILKVTDFVSGMSDSYAVSLYRLVKGLSLPVF